MTSKLIKFEYIAALFGMLSSIALIRMLGTDYKAFLAELMAANAIYLSIGLFGITIVLQKDFHKMGKNIILISIIIPFFICFIDYIFNISHTEGKYSIFLKMFFLITFCLSTLLASAFISNREIIYYFIVIISPSLVIMTLIIMNNIIVFEIHEFFYLYSILNFLVLAILFARFRHPFRSNYSYKDAVYQGLKFSPYNILQALPINLIYLCFLDSARDIAIFSVIISVSQFINKIPRLFFQLNLSRKEKTYKDYAYIKKVNFIFTIIIISLSILFLEPIYDFRREEYAIPLCIILISNLFLPAISKFDSDNFVRNNFMIVYLHRSTCLIIFSIAFVSNIFEQKIIFACILLFLIRFIYGFLVKIGTRESDEA